jgi:hypothetical protein
MVQAMRQSARAAMSGPMRARHAKNRGWYFRALEQQRAAAEAEALPPFPETPLHGRARPRAFVDFAVGDSSETIRVEFELAVRRGVLPLLLEYEAIFFPVATITRACSCATRMKPLSSLCLQGTIRC